MIVPIVLAGGVGIRLWPLSRESFPKQFSQLIGQYSLFQQTLSRCEALSAESTLLICNEKHYFHCLNQMEAISFHNYHFLIEPVGRNTAPAIAAAAFYAKQQFDEDAILLVMPSDHVISDNSSFIASVNEASRAAREGKLVTFGIEPQKPHSGYGYIKVDRTVEKSCYPVERFVEKPNVETAAEYIAAGNYYWNSGIFVFSAAQYLNQLQEYAPDIYQACQAAYQKGSAHKECYRLDSSSFSDCRDESIDYAVMEHTHSAMMVPLACDWSDLGSWTSVHEHQASDAKENVCTGKVVARDTEGCYLHSEGRLLATLGVKDHIIINTQDAVLVAHRDYAQEIKKLVKQLGDDHADLVKEHCRVYRSWGYYENITHHDHFRVKHFVVKPKESVPLQSHQQCAKHWAIVKGCAEITCDGKIMELQKK